MKLVKGYFTFEDLKKLFKLPEDALIKYMSVNNETNEFEFTFYTNDESFGEIEGTTRRHKFDLR